MSKEAFVETVTPLVEILGTIDLADPVAAKQELEKKAPADGELIVRVRRHAEQGMREGWLLTKEVGGIQFGRPAKDLLGFSVDAVLLDKAGPRHRHPKGEIDLCFTQTGDARFDGQPEGWVVYAPDTEHVPTVTEGEMLILYFLPEGAFELVQ